MRRMSLVVAVLLAAAGARAQEKPKPGMAGADDQRAIRKLVDDFTAAWNKDDAKAMAALWAEAGDLVNPVGRVARGRAEIETLFTDEHTGPFKATRFTADCPALGIRMVKPDVAIVDCSWEVAGMKDPAGKMAPPLKGLSTGVVVKSGGRWQWVALRPMVPMAPMPPAPKP